MKNTIVKYDKEEVFFDVNEQTPFDVSDYFSKQIFITDMSSEVENWNEYLDKYRMTDDDKLERISYELYGTTDYWDIIFLLNKRDPLFDMPYNFDTVSDDSTSFLDTYRFFIYANAPLYSSSRSDELKEEFLSEDILKNETFRYIDVIKPSRMSDFIALLKENGYT